MAKRKRAPARRSRATKIARRSRATKIARRSRATKIVLRKGASSRKKAAPKSRPLPTIRNANGGRGEERRVAATKPEAAAKAVKRKGGPIPGTPSPMRTRMSAELSAYARRLYEETDQPATHIALDCGVWESVVRRMAQREGWVRFVPPPRDLPPPVKLPAEVEALEKALLRDRHPEVLAEGEPRRMAGTTEAVSHRSRVHPRSDFKCASRLGPTCSGAQERAPQGDGESAADDAEQNIDRMTRIVMAHLDEMERVRQGGKLLTKHHNGTARAIGILTEAFNRLQRTRATLPGSIHHDSAYAHADMPADIDEFRLDLAKRIAAFMESRPDDGDSEEAAAASPDEVRS